MPTATSPTQASGASHFRELLPPKGHPKLNGLSSSSAKEWYESHKNLPPLVDFLSQLEIQNLQRPHKGLTSDGNVREGLFEYATNEGAPVQAMVNAASELIDVMSDEQRADTVFDSPSDDEIRMWSNPEFYVNPGGLRLDECSKEIQDAVHNVLKSSLSPIGYGKVLGCLLVNGFLGELVDGRKVMNEHSYNFRFFGQPDLVKPWGFTFFGHHLCIVVVVAGPRMVIGPTFMGAEPDVIDEGPHAGLRLFSTERKTSLRLMQSLSDEQKEKALLWHSVDPDELPEGRWTAHDERHVGGARQDNRIVPYEGCPASLLNAVQKRDIVTLFRAFNEYYPEPVLAHREATFKAHLDETYFAWIGSHEEDSTYYFRVHSPVALMEFDFHSGVFLTNKKPDKCHIHTINRIPNRGDYGRVLLDQFEKKSQT